MPKEFVRPVPVIGSDSALISINLLMIGEWLTAVTSQRRTRRPYPFGYSEGVEGSSRIGWLASKRFRFWPDAVNSQNRSEL